MGPGLNIGGLTGGGQPMVRPPAERTQGFGTPIGARTESPMRLVSNAELDQIELDKSAAREDIPEIPQLVSDIQTKWAAAKSAKERIQRQILSDYRQRNGEYDPAVLSAITKHGGSQIFMMLTALKCRTLESWIYDVMMPADDRAWDLDPTPIPEIPPNEEMFIKQRVMGEAQEAFRMGMPATKDEVLERMKEIQDIILERTQSAADDAAKKMSDLIQDQLDEGGWSDCFSDLLYDFVTTRACIVHGPVNRKVKKLSWEQDQMSGEFRPVESEVIEKVYERRSPLDIYPSADSTGIDDGYLFDRQRPTPGDLYAMKGTTGFFDGAIDKVLEQYSAGGLRNWMWSDMERANVESKYNTLYQNAERRIDMLVYNGPVRGKDLMEWGVPGVSDPLEEIEVSAWLIGPYLVGLRSNNNPGDKRPYAKASLEKVPGAFWGHGLSYILYDIQEMCNGAARANANNMGISSGPQVVINDISRLPDGEKIESLFPWKIWQFGPDKLSTSHRPPIEFFQPNSMTAELLGVYDKFAAMADEFVPSYMGGATDTTGAASTASGLSMLISQASKTVKKAIANLDKGVVARIVYLTYLDNMLYSDDQSIKGDITVIPKGAVSLLTKEQQQIRRNEFLQSTANPYDMQIMGIEGRANVLRETAKALDMPSNDVVPDADSIGGMADQSQIQQQVQQIIMALSKALNLPPETLMQLIQQQQGQAQGRLQQGAPAGPSQGRALDQSGAPVSGQDTAVF